MQQDPSPSADILERLEKAEQMKLMGDHRGAIEILEKLLVEDPENISALEEVADNELSLEQYDRAGAAAKCAIDLDDKSYMGHYIMGFLQSHKEQWPEALESLRTANSLKSNNPEILRCLGWTLFNSDKRAQGIVTLERSLNLDPENPLALCDLGVCYLQARNFIKARALFQRALDLDPGNERAQECVDAVKRLESAVTKK